MPATLGRRHITRSATSFPPEQSGAHPLPGARDPAPRTSAFSSAERACTLEDPPGGVRPAKRSPGRAPATCKQASPSPCQLPRVSLPDGPPRGRGLSRLSPGGDGGWQGPGCTSRGAYEENRGVRSLPRRVRPPPRGQAGTDFLHLGNRHSQKHPSAQATCPRRGTSTAARGWQRLRRPQGATPSPLSQPLTPLPLHADPPQAPSLRGGPSPARASPIPAAEAGRHT